MVRSHTVTRAARPWLPASGAVVLAILVLVCRPGAQAQSAATSLTDDAKILASLLDRAATTSPGTYIMSAGSLAPAPDAISMLVQADAVRTERSIRIPVVVGAELPYSSVLGVRIVTVAAGAEPPRVVAEAGGSGQAGRVRFIREFTLSPGIYDVHAAVGHQGTAGGLIAALVKTRLIVPDLWRDPMAVSPVVLGDAVAPAPQTTAAQPFTFGPTVLSPATSARYAQSGQLHVAFRVFNWSGQAGARPDLNVEYVFHQQGPRRLSFFNKLKVQHLRDATLGSTFDAAAGVVTAGVTVPLGSFPIGEFQLAVRVTDNRTRQAAERQVRFIVAP